MNRSAFLWAAISGLSLATTSGCAAHATESPLDADEEAVDAAEDALSSSSFGYFVVTRRDMRKCMAPLCGGYFVKRVNEAKTTCADGTRQVECYVSEIQLGSLGLSPQEQAFAEGKITSGQGLVRARTYRRTWRGIKIGVLKSSEAWVGATDSPAEGTFFRVADNGIRCVRAPCPSTTAYELNSRKTHNLIGVNLDQTTTPASDDALSLASRALGTAEGLLVSGGLLLPKCVPNSDCGPKVTATEFFLRMTHREGALCGGRGMGVCNLGQFCQWDEGDLCGMADAPGTCAYAPEVCPTIYKPVCGCDGKTYTSACAAAQSQASVAKLGACSPP